MPIKHIGLLKPHPEKVNKLIEAVKDLGVFSIGLSNVVSFSHGPYESTEGLNQEFTYAFEVVFSDEKARNEYLNNETHISLAKKITDNLKNPEDFKKCVAVVDFEDNSLTIRSLCDFVQTYISVNEEKINMQDEDTLAILRQAHELLQKAQTKPNPVFNKIINLKTFFNTQNGVSFNINRALETRGRVLSMIHKIDNILEPPVVEKSNTPKRTIQ